jgi:hypothetical protein
MGHEQGVFARRFVFGLPNDPFYFGGVFFLQFEFISKGENDMKRNAPISRNSSSAEIFGRRKADLCAFTPGGRWRDERWKRKEEEKDDEGEE